MKWYRRWGGCVFRHFENPRKRTRNIVKILFYLIQMLLTCSCVQLRIIFGLALCPGLNANTGMGRIVIREDYYPCLYIV